MHLLVSPYHLTTKEPPAMAALLLGDPVVTLLPAPAGEVNPGKLRNAVAAAPRYMKFMESWNWSRRLWEAGIITSLYEGHDAASDVRRAWTRITSDASLSLLRPFMREDLFCDEHHYLDAIAHDVLRGGPDPAICVPVNAGLDRFAAIHGLVITRSAPKSVAQKAELQLATKGFALVLPVFLQASDDRLMLARALLADVLGDLRDAIDMEFHQLAAAYNDLRRDRPARTPRPSPRLTDAAAAYSQAFEDLRPELTDFSRDDDARLVIGSVVLEAIVLPADAVLASSAAAALRVHPNYKSLRNAPEQEKLPALADPAMQRPVLSLIIRAMGA